MSLSFPRDLVLEAYLGPALGWVDLTGYLLQTANVTVTRGRHGEQERPAPGTLTARLNDSLPGLVGNMTPDNPMGLYYGLLTQYTQFRLSLRYGVDQLNRVAVNGWGTSPSDGVWTTNGGAAGDYAVDGTRGTHATNGSSQKRRTWLADTSGLRNYELRVRLPAMASLPLGTSAYQSLMLRGTGADAHLSVDCRLDATETVNLAIRGGDDNTFVVPAFAVGTRVAGHAWTLAAQVEGQAVRAKLWDSTAGPEPYDWQVTFVDDGFFLPAAGPAGWAGVRTSSASNTSSWTYYYDDFEIRLVRFYGEAAEFRPQWDESHRVRWVDFVAADLTRRMGNAGERRAKSALTRYVELNAVQPLAYWALDDGELASSARVTVSTVPALPAAVQQTFIDGSPSQKLGAGQLAPWFANSCRMDGGALIRASLAADYVGTGWTAHAVVSFEGGVYGGMTGPPTANTYDFFQVLGTASDFTYAAIDSYLNEIQIVVRGISAGTITAPVNLFDGAPHHIGFRLKQNGGNVDWSFIHNGSVFTNGSVTTTVGNVKEVDFNQNGNLSSNDDLKTRSVGSLALYAGDGPPLAEFFDAAMGHSGERAGLRAQRVCAEEGIPFAYVGDLSDTEPMGPQFQDTVLEVLQECAATDRATLTASRSSTGFVFRTYRSLTQPAALTLDYAGGQVARPFLPVRGDRDVRNLVTVRRRSGGELTVEQTTGPLNTGDPGGADPSAAGVNDASVDVNVVDEGQLAALGGREVARGTVPGSRFDSVRVDLRAAEVGAAKQAEALGADVDDRVVVQNAAAAKIFDPVDQVARGYTETFLHVRAHELALDCAPYAPYRTFVLDSDRLDTDDSTLASGAAAGQALPYTLSVATAGSTLWCTTASDPGEFPFDVVVAGQRLTISGIAGASSPQTFTVSARANGVDKAQAAGARVSLADPAVLG